MSPQLAIPPNTDNLFSMPLEALSSLRSSLARWRPLDLSGPQVLPLGISALDAALPGGGVALGGITELQIRGASGIATSFALAACRAAQCCQGEHGRGEYGRGELSSSRQSGSRQSGSRQSGTQLENGAWCAFIDPGASLFAPGMVRLGVDLSRLLVTRPPAEAIDRVAVRIAETNLMAMLVIDLRCLVQAGSLNEHSWQRAVRRLSLAVKSSFTSILLITQAEQFRSLPLPTFQRLELSRRSQSSFELKVAKERTGRVSAARLFPCSIFDLSNFSPTVLPPRRVIGSNVIGSNVIGSNVIGSNVIDSNVIGGSVIGGNDAESIDRN